ncbi:MAG: hypothetical protein HZB67_06225 [Candidatus Aenigmarchaeota archaeon]|nr:hypothetical protein [Candidatus Aenigmarchaeota archaeon]
MKILFEYEDCIYGIIIGVILIGLSGTFFTLPDYPMIWGALFGIAAILTILDVRHTFSDLSGHSVLIILALLNNIIDLILEIALTAKMFNLDIPYLSEQLNPYLNDPTMLAGIGTFFIVTSCLWIYEFHKR